VGVIDRVPVIGFRKRLPGLEVQGPDAIADTIGGNAAAGRLFLAILTTRTYEVSAAPQKLH
jgi:hypothetical protein